MISLSVCRNIFASNELLTDFINERPEQNFFPCFGLHITLTQFQKNEEQQQQSVLQKAFIYGATVFRHTQKMSNKTQSQGTANYIQVWFPLSSVWNQVAPLPESGPLHGHTVVQFPLQDGLGGGEPSHVGFD